MSTGDRRNAITVDAPVDQTASLPGDEVGPPTPTDPLPLREPGRYLLYEEHARGGIGRILRAEDRDLDRELAIKELLTDDESARARFVREARITARLEHPGIVPVHDAGRWIGSERPFYAMKLVGGKPLKSVVAKTTSLEERLPLLRHIAAIGDAIAYAHSRGVIHRDLTPTNVMIGDFGETVVIDWGLAKEIGGSDPLTSDDGRAHGSDDVTRAGSVLGTPAFMAPEQARGESVDQRADIYALGALLYYTLCGAPLYDPRPGDFLKRVIHEPPVPLKQREPRISPDLVAIVEKATAREPGKRYPTAGELVADLRRYQEGNLVAAHAYTPRELAVRWVRQRRLAVALTAVFACLLATGGIVSFAREQRLRVAAEAARREAESRTLALLEEYGRRELDAGRPGRAVVYLAEAFKRRPDSRVLRWLLSQAAQPLQAHVATLRGHDRDVIATALTADAKLLATASGDKTVKLWDVASQRELRVLRGHERMLEDVTFSPDGTLVASSDAGKAIRIWRVDTGELVREHPGNAYRLAFSADGTQLWAGGKKGQVQAWEVATGKTLVDQTAHTNRVGGLVIDGDRAITASWDGTLLVWRDFAVVDRMSDQNAGLWFASRCPESKLIVTGDDKGMIVVRDAATLAPRTRLHLPAGSHATSAWCSPDGNLLTTVSADGMVNQWHLASGQPLLTLDAVAHGKVFDGAYSPATGLLATASLRALDLWQLDRIGDRRVLGKASQDRSEIGPAVLSGDGSAFVSARLAASGETSLQVWDAPRGTLEASWPEAGMPSAVAVNRRGDRIAMASFDLEPPRLYDRSGKLIARLAGHERTVYALAVSPDDRLLASASYDRTVRLWTAADGKPAGVVMTTQVRPTGVAFDPARPRVAVVDEDGQVTFFGLDGTRQATFAAHPTWIEYVAFNGDGTRLVTAGRQDHTAKIWDLVGNRPPVILSGHLDNLNRATFSPDGAVVATVSVDDTARLWDVETGELLRTIRGPVTAAAFPPDGRELYTAGENDYVVAWRIVLDERSASDLGGAMVASSPWRLDGARLVLRE
jgi:eukaryotic-like serine/threonine-protein kinase